MVIDLTGDFRLDDSEVFERYYGSRSEVPQLLADFVPCLLELHWECLRGADLVIVPGCLATAGALALHLLVAGDLNASKRGPSSTPGPAPAVQAPPSAKTATGGGAVRGVQTTCHAALRSGVDPLHRPTTLMARRISRVRYSTTPGFGDRRSAARLPSPARQKPNTVASAIRTLAQSVRAFSSFSR